MLEYDMVIRCRQKVCIQNCDRTTVDKETVITDSL